MSLLEVSAHRLEGLVDPARRYICTGEQYRSPIRAALPEFTDERILGEPCARDTLNAVGFAAAVFAKADPHAVFAVFTADHVIRPVEAFRDLVDLGFRLVEANPDRLVTFSITPTYPATGFGYVERGAPVSLPATTKPAAGAPAKDAAASLAFRVARFVEKPNIERAQAYVHSGLFGWNSGMFVWNAATVLECIRRYKPDCHAGLMRIQAAWGTPDQARVLAEVYPTLPKVSIDYAVMEPASTDPRVQVCTVLMNLQWLDVGSWPSYAQTLAPDADSNRRGGPGAANSLILRGKRNLVVCDDPKHTVTLLGCEDLIVVHTPEATLIMPAAHAEQLKDLHAAVNESLR